MSAGLTAKRTGMLSSEWLAESCRLTIFHSSIAEWTDLWEGIVGSKANEVSQRASEQQRIEAGDFQAGVLVCARQANRTDIVYSAKQNTDQEASSRPVLAQVGPSSAALLTAMSIFEKLDAILRDANRIALGPILLKQTESVDLCNKIISEKTGFPLRGGESDIQIAYNRALEGKSFSGKVNAIRRWQALQLQNIPVVLGMGNLIQTVQVPGQINSIFSVRVDFDFNTAQSDRPSDPLPDPKAAMAELFEVATAELSEDSGAE